MLIIFYFFNQNQTHQQHRKGVTNIFNWDGSQTNSQIFGIVVAHHGFVDKTAGQNSVDQGKGNQYYQESDKKSA